MVRRLEELRGNGLALTKKRRIMSQVSFGDAARDHLRALVATIDQEISRLPPRGDAKPADDHVISGLRASWLELVKALALGPAPETRTCPVCGTTGMRAASRCACCWTKLELLAAVASTALPPTTVVTDAPKADV
jgi:hypothetical protein